MLYASLLFFQFLSIGILAEVGSVTFVLLMRERERGFWQRLFRSFQVAFSGDYWLQQKQKQGLEIGGKDMRLKGGAPGIYIFS